LSGKLTARGFVERATDSLQTFLKDQLDYVFVCIKAIDNAQVAHQLAQQGLTKYPVFVSCQNGIDVEDVFIHHFGSSHTLRMILNIGCGITAIKPGCAAVDVKFKFSDILSKITAANQTDEQLAKALAACGIPVTLSVDFKKEAFRKAILNTALGTVCAITRLTMREVMQREDLHRMVKEIVREGSAVGRKLNFDFGDAFLEEAMAYLSQGGHHKPSLALDIERGQVSENPWLAGAIYHYAERLGLEVPVIQTVYYFIRAIEGRAQGQSRV